MPHLRFFVAVSMLIFAGSFHAEAAPLGFQSPSRNIACQYFDYDGWHVFRCDMGMINTRPRRRADCVLEYGRAFEMNPKGRAGRICHRDTVIDTSLPVLAYGEAWQQSGFNCKLAPSGLTCSNTDRHGFSLARAKQAVF